MIDLGTGEIANRLRRALFVRGRIPMKLDESALVPAAKVFDATRAPFRRRGIQGFGSLITTASVGNLSVVRLSPLGARETAEGEVRGCEVQGYTIVNPNAATMPVTVGFDAGLGVGTSNVFSGEAGLSGALDPSVPLAVGDALLDGLNPAATLIDVVIARYRLKVDDTIIVHSGYPMELWVPTGTTLLFETQLPNQTLTVSVETKSRFQAG